MKGKYFQGLLFSLSTLVAILMIVGDPPLSMAQPASKTPIKIGVVHSLSGTAGVFGGTTRGEPT